MTTMESEKESKLVIIKDPENTIPCLFCKTTKVDEIHLGPMHVAGDVICHYYCMLMSAALSQNGNDDQGILGFLPADIRKEARRAQRLRCSHCNKTGASVGCCKKSCKHVYHFPCGLECGVNYQFHGNYEAFCKDHAIPQNINNMESREWRCPICLSLVTEFDESIASNCCKGAVFHKVCLKAMALNAGYFFKCPMCNSTDDFKKEMRNYGIFVPEQDASWEREPNAFQDLLFQYSQCDAEKCLSVKGREYNASKGGFMLARCRICGAAGIHRECGQLKTVANWACNECAAVEKKTEEERLKKLKENEKSLTSILSGRPQERQMIINAISESKCANNYVDDSEEEVDLTKVKISPSCWDYFPYHKKMMSQFQQRQPPIVPDWRNFVLRINVVDWFGHYVRKTLNIHFPPPRGIIKTPSERIYPSVKLYKPRIKSEVVENAPGISSYATVVHGRASKKKPRRYKRTRWGRGVLSKKRGKDKKHWQINSNESTIDLKPSTITLNCQFIKKEPIGPDDVNAEDYVMEPVSDELAFKVPYPVKKRPVLELSHTMQANGISQDIFVQSNIEIAYDNIKEEPMDKDDMEIDLSSLRPLGTENLKVGDDDSLLDMNEDNSDNWVNEGDKNMESQFDENKVYLNASKDHTYATRFQKAFDSINQYLPRKSIEKSGEQGIVESETF